MSDVAGGSPKGVHAAIPRRPYRRMRLAPLEDRLQPEHPPCSEALVMGAPRSPTPTISTSAVSTVQVGEVQPSERG